MDTHTKLFNAKMQKQKLFFLWQQMKALGGVMSLSEDYSKIFLFADLSYIRHLGYSQRLKVFYNYSIK